MKIGIIGSGNIGGTLGHHFSKAGHEVFFSCRHPEEIQDLAKENDARCGTVEQAIEFGPVLLLAVPFKAIEDVAQKGDFEDKIIIDATNPYPSRDGEIAEKALKEDTTASEYVAKFFPDANIVKAFNSVFYKVLENRPFHQGNERLAIHMCGNDEKAKQIVTDLIDDIGMAPMDIGDLYMGRYFQPGGPLYTTHLNIKEAREFWEMIQDMQGGQQEQRKAA